MKKYLWMPSAAVVIGALRIKMWLDYLQFYILFNSVSVIQDDSKTIITGTYMVGKISASV